MLQHLNLTRGKRILVMKKSFDCNEFMQSVRREVVDKKYLKERYADWRRLLDTEGEEFIRYAYGVVLKRNVDASGFNNYVPILKKRMGKCRVIASLLLSPEKTGKNFLCKYAAKIIRFGRDRFKCKV